MVNKLFDEYSSNMFISNTMNMVDDAMHFLREDNDAKNDMAQTMNSAMFAKEFRTVGVHCRRQIGHTHLINKLAYDINSHLGRKYSTIIVAPKRTMAEQLYGINAAHYEPHDDYSAMQDYAATYRNCLAAMRSPISHFVLGKAATFQQLERSDFDSRRFIKFNKEVITQLTDIDMTDKKIDLVCIDCAGFITERQRDCLYEHFSDHVELFLFLQ